MHTVPRSMAVTSSPEPVAGAALREHLFSLLDELHAEMEPASESEERIGRRWPVQAPVMIGRSPIGSASLARPGAPLAESSFPFSHHFEVVCHGWATDISESGIGLLTEIPLEIGQPVQVSLQSLLNRPMTVPLRIVYARQILKHTYRVGAQFMFD